MIGGKENKDKGPAKKALFNAVAEKGWRGGEGEPELKERGTGRKGEECLTLTSGSDFITFLIRANGKGWFLKSESNCSAARICSSQNSCAKTNCCCCCWVRASELVVVAVAAEELGAEAEADCCSYMALVLLLLLLLLFLFLLECAIN